MKKNYFILVLVGIVTTIALSSAAFNSFQQLIKALLKGRDLRTQKEEMIILLSDIKDAETGQRGYAITGSENYLQPYYMALQTIDEHFRILSKNLSPFPKQQILLEDLSRLIKLKLAELQDVINTRRTQGFEAAQKKVQSGEGKQYMDQIRTVMNEIFNNQNQEIEGNVQKVELLIQKSFLLSLLGGIISSVLISVFSLMFYRDSVELARVKKQFRQTNDLYKAILDSAKQMMVTTDTTGVITSFNKAAEKVLGYKADEVTNQLSVLDLYDRKELRNKAEELKSKTKPMQYTDFDTLVASSRYLIWIDSEWTMRKKNGTLFSSSQTITALRDEANTITGYLIIGSDTSEHKRWEQELKEAQEAIELAQLSKNRFLASFNHEFQAPLNTMMKFSSLLMKNVGGNLTDLEIAYATRIRDNCQAMLSLMNEIIDLSKREDTMLLNHMQAIKLEVFVRKMIEEMDKPQNIQFIIEIPKDVPPLETEVDSFRDLLKHLIRSVIHQFQGQIMIQLKTDRSTSKPIEMEISQNGTKIPSIAPEQDSIDFAVAESLANRLGYQIKVASRLGRGMIYSLLFHSSEQATGFLKSNTGSTLNLSTGSEGMDKKLNLTVLVIDDDEDFRTLLTHYLEELGCRVIQAETGTEVVELAKSQPVDLITMDMLMAPMNGYEIVQQLKNDPLLKRIPYAFISVIAKDIENKIPGALAFINKPLTKEDIAHLLQLYQVQRKFL